MVRRPFVAIFTSADANQHTVTTVTLFQKMLDIPVKETVSQSVRNIVFR